MALLDLSNAPHGGRQRHLPEWQSQPRIKPTTIIDHSIVGGAEGAWQMFKDRSVLESHFIVDLDGEIWQLMDTDRQADANLDANDFAISIETADRGDPDNQPWTAAQLDSLIWLHEQLLATHSTIPRQKCPTWNGSGLGYHTLFGAPSHWTPVAKSCPGRVRKVQWAATVLPAFLHPEEDTVSAAEVIAWFKSEDGIRLLRKATWGGTGEEIPSIFGTVNAAQVVEAGAKAAQGANSKAGDLTTAVAAVASRVAAIKDDVDHLVAGEPLEPIEGHALGGAPLKLSPHEIAQLAIDAGWTGEDLRTAVAVCLAESSLDGGKSADTEALGRSTTGTALGNRDHGLWQISGFWHGAKLEAHPAWRDPATNALLGKLVWDEFKAAGKDPWSAWAAYNSGSHEKYLPDADIALKAPFPVTS